MKRKKVRKAREKKFTADEVQQMINQAHEAALNPPAMAKATLDRKQLGEHVAGLISNERNETHGDPHVQFECAQAIKNTLMIFQDRAGRLRHGADPTRDESLDLICTKISRLVCGSNLQDAWLDIAGYALIAAEKAEKPL